MSEPGKSANLKKSQGAFLKNCTGQGKGREKYFMKMFCCLFSLYFY